MIAEVLDYQTESAQHESFVVVDMFARYVLEDVKEKADEQLSNLRKVETSLWQTRRIWQKRRLSRPQLRK